MPAWKIWAHGIIAGFICGAAGGFGAAVGALAIGDPLNHGLQIAGVAALFSGIVGAAGYLKQSPVPKGWDGTDRRNGVTP